ncbi:MAG: sigma-54-dependent Fis family transcriptional regulator [Deltaproteobacteria bacterium]|nr:sigma-54-dependent Fis family transcriptional regulator [Deltaproteobacteria bacterium]
MELSSSEFRDALAKEMDPSELQKNFLTALLDLQNVERGSIWVKEGDEIVCVEATGEENELIRGVRISAHKPSFVGWVIQNRKMTIGRPGVDPRHHGAIEKGFEVKSTLILTFPLFLRNGEVYGALQLIDTSANRTRLNLDEDYLKLLQNLVNIGSIAIASSLAYQDQIHENRRLEEIIRGLRDQVTVIGQSPSFLNALKLARDYAMTDFPVLITGESGTGKDVISNEIHRLSERRSKPFLVQNCSAIPETLLESELFGHKKGAFTGADKDRKGLFETANGGVVFLDEIGDMPLQLQARILRVIENKEIKPLGGSSTKKIDVRIIAATHKDLKEAIAQGQFRQDLFYRLNVLPLRLPALRERPEDIPLLLNHFIKRETLRLGIPQKKVSKEALQRLRDYPWKGNIRELENFVKYILVIAASDAIDVEDLPPQFLQDDPPEPVENRDGKENDASAGAVSPDAGPQEPLSEYSWRELERRYFLELLEKNKWSVTRSARDADMKRTTFDARMRKLGISRN